MKTGWILCRGDVLASAEMTTTALERARGLLGRRSYDGALLLTRTRSVHTLGMHFGLDVAFLTRDLVVVATTRMPRWRISLPRRGGRVVLEAAAGSFERWNFGVGDQLEFREAE